MKQAVNFYDFDRAFIERDRENKFTYEGRKALFEYLEDLEDDIGEEIELDVIALCCEYEEYKNVYEYLDYYTPIVNKADYEDEEEFNEAVKEEIRENTTLIEIDDNSFIIQQY